MHSWMGGKHNDSWFGPYQFWVPLQNSAHILSSWLKEKLAADISMHKINSNILLCVWNNLSLLYISTSKFYNEKKKGEHITYFNILFKNCSFQKSEIRFGTWCHTEGISLSIKLDSLLPHLTVNISGTIPLICTVLKIIMCFAYEKL